MTEDFVKYFYGEWFDDNQGWDRYGWYPTEGQLFHAYDEYVEKCKAIVDSIPRKKHVKKKLSHPERCWINEFKSQAGYEKRWDRQYCLENGIRPNDLYEIRKSFIREDQLDDITPYLEEFPKALTLARQSFSAGQGSLHKKGSKS